MATEGQKRAGPRFLFGASARLVAVILALAWLFAVYVAYYVAHKPFVLPQVGRLAGQMLDLTLLAFVLAVAMAWGAKIAERLALDFADVLEKVVFGAAFGLGALAYLVFGLGTLGLLHRWIIDLLVLALAFGVRRELVAGLRTGLRIARRGAAVWAGMGAWTHLVAAYIVVVGVLVLARSLAPAVAWDALVYHLELPRQYLAQSGIRPPDGFFYAHLPQLTEMLFLVGLALRGDILAQLFHAGFATLLCLAVFSAGRRWFSTQAAWLAVAFLMSIPEISLLAGWPYVDLALCFFLFCSLQAFFRWRETGTTAWLWTSAICGGLALAAKYTGAIWLGTLLLALSWEMVIAERRSLALFLRRAAGFGVLAGLVACPFYLKTLIMTGNPFYPFVFGGAGWNGLRSNWLTGVGFGLGADALAYLLLPWNMTVNGLAGSASFDADVGPVLLAMVPLALVVGLPGRVRVYLLCFAIVQFAFLGYSAYHLVSMLQTRLVLGLFPLLCLLAADLLDRLRRIDRPRFSLQRFAYLAVGLALILNLWSAGSAFLADGSGAYLVGEESRRDYLTRTLGDYYRVADYVNNTLDPATTVALWWEPRGYYFRRPVLADPTLDALPQLVAAAEGDVDGVYQALVDRGIAYVVLNVRGLAFLRDQPRYPLTERDLGVLAELRERYLVTLASPGESYRLFELARAPVIARPPVADRQ